MNLGISNRTAIVCGASRGLGYAISTALASEGVNLVMCARDAKVLAEAVAAEFADDPPRFLERAPFGYADPLEIERDMRAGGFTDVAIETVGLSSRLNAKEAAIAMCAGSPMTAEIAERGGGAIERATRAAEAALRQFDGQEMPMSALFVTATR